MFFLPVKVEIFIKSEDEKKLNYVTGIKKISNAT